MHSFRPRTARTNPSHASNFRLRALPSAVALGLLAPIAHADLLFSEYVEGSSNNKALEIFNNGTTPVNLSGYNVFMSFNGGGIVATINLTGTVAPNDVFVLAHASANATILAAADQTSSASWYNGDDAILLRNGTTVIDSIGQQGVDPGAEWGSGLISTADNTLRRKTTIITGDTIPNDAFDPSLEWDGFAQDTFDGLGSHDGNTGGPGGPGGGTGGNCGDSYTLISAIQGSGASSPLAGTTVSIEAIVVADLQGAGQLGGFFVQQADVESDGNTATSEGLYIAGGATAVNVGDHVRVTGAVAETYGLTQLTATGVTVCASGEALPSAAILNLPFASAATPEAAESMRVSLPQTLTVSETYELGRYGQILLSNGRLLQPTNVVAPGAAANALQAQNNLNKILLDDGSNVQNPDPVPFPAPGLSASNTLRGGDTVANIQGVLAYDFGEYRVLPTQAPAFVHSNPRPAPLATPAGTNLTVASFNVLNFFNGDGLGGGFPTSRGADTAAEFQRQTAKTVSAIQGLNADVIGLTEIENDGYGPNSAIADLVQALNLAVGASIYAYVNPGVSKIGTDEIAVGFIYRSDRVEALSSRIFDSTFDPRFIDTRNRPVLAQTFRLRTGNHRITVAVNHLKSKGSDCNDLGDPDTGDGQGNCAQTRTSAAQALVDWLQTDPTYSGEHDFLIIGDLNAYAQETPITVIKNGGFVDLINQFAGNSAYSYVFDGQAGYLDHALASRSLAPQVLDARDWHINADEPISLDYNLEFKSPGQQTSFYAPNAFRSSDHDPLVVTLKLVADQDDDGDVDNDDVRIVTGLLNDEVFYRYRRDINGDGVINVLDVRALVLQCTRARCSTN